MGQLHVEERAPEGVRVAELFVKTLLEAGITAVFGVPGGAISAVYDALLDEPRIRVVNLHHEATAMFAAMAWARQTGKVGVVLTTSGPGVTNALTGLASAWVDGVPVLLVGGEVPRQNFGRGALQDGSVYELNVVGMVKGMTKLAAEVRVADSAIFSFRKAITTALSGRRGPVFLSLPLDIQGTRTQPPRMAVNVGSQFELDRPTLNAAVGKLLLAERPLVLAGSGARWGDGPRALKAFAERYQLPVATTPKAKGVFPETHRQSLGVFGYGGHPSAQDYLAQGVDVLLAVGTSFNDVATDSWSEALRPTDSFIQIDIDSVQIGRNYPADLGLVGDAALLLNELTLAAPPLRPVRELPGRRLHGPPDLEGEGLIKPQRALYELQQVLPGNALYACDIGEHLMWALHYLTVSDPRGFYTASGLGAMTSSLGAALGMKLAEPDRPVVCICGDGTLSMSSEAIADSARMKLPVLFFVMNDFRYGMVEEGHKSLFGRTPAFPISVDLEGIAQSAGARYLCAQKPGDILGFGLKALLAGTGPVVVDVRIDPAERLPKRPRFDALRKQGRLTAI
jgi:acetolactate synthase-1/2/3 large subunit